MKDYVLVIAMIALTVVCWGAYGPVLHMGQDAMDKSRLRPFLFVGVAYFVIAVLVPLALLKTGAESSASFTRAGVFWSSLAGAAGAIGALGIIMAFNFGGKPSYVMPLVFGCAPVINALLTIVKAGTYRQVSPAFLAGLCLVALGAALVLRYTPSGHGPAIPSDPVVVAPAVNEPADKHSLSANDSTGVPRRAAPPDA